MSAMRNPRPWLAGIIIGHCIANVALTGAPPDLPLNSMRLDQLRRAPAFNVIGFPELIGLAGAALLALLVYILARSFYPARIGGRGSSQRFTLLAAFGAATVFALLLFGSHVTATSQWYVFPDWPLMNGTPFPALAGVRWEGLSAL